MDQLPLFESADNEINNAGLVVLRTARFRSAFRDGPPAACLACRDLVEQAADDRVIAGALEGARCPGAECRTWASP